MWHNTTLASLLDRRTVSVPLASTQLFIPTPLATHICWRRCGYQAEGANESGGICTRCAAFDGPNRHKNLRRSSHLSCSTAVLCAPPCLLRTPLPPALHTPHRHNLNLLLQLLLYTSASIKHNGPPDKRPGQAAYIPSFAKNPRHGSGGEKPEGLVALITGAFPICRVDIHTCAATHFVLRTFHFGAPA